MKRLMIVTLLLSATLCAAQAGPAALLQADRDFAQAAAQKGVEGWMAFMAENSVRLGNPPVVGKPAIREAMAKTFARPGFKLKWAPTHGELFKGGDLGYTVGRYEMSRQNEKGESVITHGTYLTVWQKQEDGSWKVVWDGGSQDPAPTPAPKQ
jgi:ketosteroid isomerase-like protein